MDDHDDHTGEPDEDAGGEPMSSSRHAADSLLSHTRPETTSELSKVRELILSAFPDLVPELVSGQTVDDLISSVDVARDAFKAVAERIGSSESTGAGVTVAATGTAPRVPAGGGAARQFVVNIEELSPSAKIAEGLRQRTKRA